MGPLAGIRIVEFANGIHGPYAAMLLGDMGAEVVKVEPPWGDMNRQSAVVETPYPVGSQFYACNRDKRSICLDLDSDDGRAVARELISNVDVVVENMRPGVLAERGLDYESLAPAHPRLIYASATGFGSRGPRAHWPSLDLVGQAAGGIVAHTGTGETGPLPAGTAIADHAGALWLAYGVMLALFHRERTGEGQLVHSSLLGSQLGLQAWEFTYHLLSGQEPPRGGRGHGLARGAWQIFPAKNGHFALAGVTDSRWPALCDAIDAPHLKDDPRLASAEARLENTELLVSTLAQIFTQYNIDDLLARLEAGDQIVSKVMNYGDLAEDPQVEENAYRLSYMSDDRGELPMAGIPVELSATPGAVSRRPPDMGEHTSEILAELGYKDAAISDLYATGAVGPRVRGEG